MRYFDAPRCLVLTTYTPYASIDTMTSDIVFALKRFGYQVGHYVGGNFGDPRLFQAMMLGIGQSSAPAFVLDLNGRINPKVGEESLFDSWKLPRVSFLIDNLSRHAASIIAAPSFSMVGVIDGDSLEWADELQSRTRRFIHTPHAGPEVRAGLPTTSDRPIDLLFAGNVKSVPSLGVWLEDAVDGEKLGAEVSVDLARDILDHAIECCLETDVGMFQSVRRRAEERSMELSLQSTIYLAKRVEDYIRYRRRIDLFANIRKTPITIYGEVEAGCVPNPGDNIEVRSVVPYQELLNVMRRSKMILNVSPSLRNSGHERVFYGLSEGAHVLTDYSRYLDATFEAGQGIDFTPFDPRCIDDLAQAYLARKPAENDDRREASLDCYRRTSTWTVWVERLLHELRATFPEIPYPEPVRLL